MITNADIAIIINSYNRLELLKDCLTTLSKWVQYSPLSGRIIAIVYDANSTDGSLEWLMNNRFNLGFPIEIIIPKEGDNTSFSAGLNMGVAYAEKNVSSLKYLLFYETDNLILNEKPLLDAIAQLEDKIKLAACGFTVRKHDGSSAGVGQPFPSLINFALGKNLVQLFNLESIPYNWIKTDSNIEFSEVDVVYTSPLLVRLEAWKQVGGLDEDTFPFSECDVDLAKRLKNMGWAMGVVRSDAVIHDNLKVHSSWSKFRALHFHRARLRYFKKHKPIAIYAIWPTFLIIRHGFELLLSFCTHSTRRKQLLSQFLSLFKSSIKGYES